MVKFYRQRAFTLIELILVIIVAGILAVVAVPQVPPSQEFSKKLFAKQLSNHINHVRNVAIYSKCHLQITVTTNTSYSIQSRDPAECAGVGAFSEPFAINKDSVFVVPTGVTLSATQSPFHFDEEGNLRSGTSSVIRSGVTVTVGGDTQVQINAHSGYSHIGAAAFPALPGCNPACRCEVECDAAEEILVNDGEEIARIVPGGCASEPDGYFDDHEHGYQYSGVTTPDGCDLICNNGFWEIDSCATGGGGGGGGGGSADCTAICENDDELMMNGGVELDRVWPGDYCDGEPNGTEVNKPHGYIHIETMFSGCDGHCVDGTWQLQDCP